MTDAELFDVHFEELVSELTQRDLTDPALADALSRLAEVLNFRRAIKRQHCRYTASCTFTQCCFVVFFTNKVNNILSKAVCIQF